MANRLGKRLIPRLIERVNQNVKKNGQKSELMEHLCYRHKLLSIPVNKGRNISAIGGEKSYVMLGSLAKLERALMKWVMNELVMKHNFKPIVVPNIIYDHIIEKCGFPTDSLRSQVYKISDNSEESIMDEDSPIATSENKNFSCLAGTSEFALASIHIGDTIPSGKLPKKFCTLSRCYRAETSNIASEWGMYRVHYFNKVEMVGLTMPDESSIMHEEFLRIQKDIFSQLGLHFQILDMPEDDLGLSAKKKYDIEAWMEGRQRFGEVSSASNCEDYQTSRLNIKYSQMVESMDQLVVNTGFVHSVNGTACSSVRTLIAMIEQHQREDGLINVPKPLIPYMDEVTSIPTSDDVTLLGDVNLN